MSPLVLNTVARNALLADINSKMGSATLEVRTGTRPESADSAATGTLLASVALGANPFSGTSTLSLVSPVTTTVLASGTVGYLRLIYNNGNSVYDFLNNAGIPSNLTAGQTLNINSLTLTFGVLDPIVPLPDAPTGLTFVSATTSAITVSWTDTSAGTMWHRVYFRLNGTSNTFEIGAEVPPGVVSTEFGGLSSATSYEIRATAFSGSEESVFSAPLVATTL